MDVKQAVAILEEIHPALLLDDDSKFIDFEG